MTYVMLLKQDKVDNIQFYVHFFLKVGKTYWIAGLGFRKFFWVFELKFRLH